MWNPFNKKELKPKKLYFPERDIKKFLTLYDDYASTPKSTLKRYNLWRYIADIFPEVENGAWHVEPRNGVKPYVCKV